MFSLFFVGSSSERVLGLRLKLACGLVRLAINLINSMNKFYILGGVVAVIVVGYIFMGHSNDKSRCEKSVRFYGQVGSGYYVINGDGSEERFESRESAVQKCMSK